jgi:hypothetical protein
MTALPISEREELLLQAALHRDPGRRGKLGGMDGTDRA